MISAAISAPEAEKAVIGSFLIEKEAITACIDLVKPDQFYEAQNIAICRIVYELYKANRPVDAVAVIEAWKGQAIEFPELPSYLSKCFESVTSAGHASYHAKTILDRYYKRETIKAAEALALSVHSDQGLNEALTKIHELAMQKEAIHAPPVYTYANGLFDFIDKISVKSGKTLYRTGYPSLDASWYGVAEGEIITIGAATNVGKSMLCLNLMHNIASRGVKCLYAGTEMSSFETTSRHVSIASGVAAHKLRIGRLDLEDHSKIHAAISDKLYKMSVTMIDNPSPSLSDINSAIVSSGAKVVFVDYLGRLRLPNAENYRLRVHEAMIGLKTMARTRNVVIFLAAQLGRQAYGQSSPKPTLADLSESKSIEAESDKVLLVWSDPAKQGKTNSVLSFINAKNRAGKRGHEFDMTLDSNTLTIREENNEVYT